MNNLRKLGIILIITFVAIFLWLCNFYYQTNQQNNQFQFAVLNNASGHLNMAAGFLGITHPSTGVTSPSTASLELAYASGQLTFLRWSSSSNDLPHVITALSYAAMVCAHKDEYTNTVFRENVSFVFKATALFNRTMGNSTMLTPAIQRSIGDMFHQMNSEIPNDDPIAGLNLFS